MTHRITDKLLTETEARITWGDEPAEIIKFLESNGVPEEEAATLVAHLSRSRNREVRKRARREIYLGMALIVLSILVYKVVPWERWEAACSHRQRRLPRTLPLVLLGVGVVGIYQIWRGFWGLLLPQREELSDLSNP